MTVACLIGLLLQASAVWTVHVVNRGRWLRHPAAMLLAVAVAEHGLTEIMQALWPGRDRYRTLIGTEAVDRWMLLVSAMILLYALTYSFIVLIVRRRGHESPRPLQGNEPGPGREGREDRGCADYVAGLDPRVLLLLVAPLAVATLLGRGAVAPTAIGTNPAQANSYLVAGAAGQYLVLLVALTGTAAVVRHGRKWTAPVLVAEAVLLALTGTRSMIVFSVVLTLVGLGVCGFRPSRRALALAGLSVVFLGVAVSASRVAVGRDDFAAGHGLQARVGALVSGAGGVGGSGNGVLDDTVYRLDANSYGALVLRELEHGVPPVGLTTVRNDLLLGVPSALYPEKLQTPVQDRNEEQYLDRWFGLNPTIDYLVGLLPVLLALSGPAGLPVVVLLLAVGFTSIELFLAGRATPVRLVMALGVAQCTLLYEAGPVIYVTSGRGVLLLSVGLWAWRRALRPRRDGAVKADCQGSVLVGSVLRASRPGNSTAP